MISQTADAGRTPTQRTTPPIETFLRVIVVSFVALTLFAIPREGAAPPPLATRVIVGSGVGGQSQVRVFDGNTALPSATPLLSFTAFTQNLGGEVRVAGCDLNNDGINEIIAGTGLGTRAEVRVFDGVTGVAFTGPRGSFLAFENGFLGGVHVACGDVTGDSVPDIIVARGALAKPEVRVFSGVTGAQLPLPLGSFFAFEQNFLGGVRVAACDLNQDGKTEIIAARGPGAQPQIRTFNGATGAQLPGPLGSFLAFNSSDRGGVYVACGNLSADTIPDIIAGKGLGQPPKVRVFNGATGTQLPLPVGSFDAFNSTFAGGARVASCRLNLDSTADIIAGRGPGDKPEVRVFDGVSGAPFTGPMGSFNAFGATFKGGVYLACSPSESGGGGPPPADTAPAVTSTIPTNGATGVTTNSNLTITFNEPVAVTGDWFQVSCPTSGPRNVTLANTVVTGGPTTWTINPNTDFAPNEICSTTIVAAQITDIDSNDPPNNMATDFPFSFTTEAAPSVSSTVPPNGATGVAVDSNITVTFSESVTTTASTFGLECPAGTPIPFVVTPAPPGNTTSYTLNPNADLPAGTCTIKVTASQVTDVDTNDPPDTMVTDFTSTFTSGANNPPSFTKGPNQTVGENAPAQTVSPWATAIDDGDPAVTQLLTFNITGNTNPSLFSAGPSVSPTGDLTYTPATNQSGTASITLTLSDDGGTPGTPGDDATSAPQTFTITVNAVNNAPSFVAGPNQSVNEDSAAQSVSPWATAIDDGDPESTQNVSFIITGNTNPSLFSAGPSVSSSGALSYTPAADAFGSATITLVLKDDGGTANPGDNDTSPPQSFTITINAVNDPPSFTVGPNQSVSEDAGLQSVSPWATAISPGPANESGQTVSFIITSNTNPTLFSAGPSVTPGGALTYTPAANANGGASIMLVIKDSGGGTDTSAPQGFTITVTAVNDPPQVTPPAAYPAHAHIIINVPDGATDLFDGSTITDVDGPGAAPFSITAAGPFASANGGSVTIAGNGSFSYNPPPGFTGVPSANDTFTYQICDSGVPGSACTNATATVAVSGPRVWFVDNTVGSSGDGRLSSPFNTLGAADTAANASGDRTFVFTGAGSYTGGFGLLLNQRLIGQGVVDTNFDTALGITPPATSVARPGINGTRPTINGTVTLATGSTARGFNVSHTTVTGVSGNGASGLTVNQVTVTTTTGTAVNLLNSGGTISFISVSANGAVNGIVLNTTAGSFEVTGTGTAGTGGTIQSTTGPGVLLSNAAGVSLAWMNIQNGLDDGIRGTTVTGFTLANSTVNNNGNAIGTGNTGDNGVDFENLLGTASITSSTITSSFHNNVIIRNSTGTLSGLTVTGTNINNNDSTTDGDGFLFEASGTANMSVNVSSSTFSAHQGDHFQAAALNSGVLNVIFSGNTLSGGHAAPLGQGITINASTGPPGYLGSVSYDLAGNTINGAISNAIFVGMGTSAASSSMIGKIRNNNIGTSGAALSCSTQANGVSVDARGNGTFTSAVTGNVIRQCFDRGILSEAGDGDSVLNLTVTGNTIDQQVGTLTREAIQTNHGITSTNVFGNVDTNAVCVQLGGAGALANTFSHGAGAPDDFRLRKRFEATVRLPGYAGGTGQDATSLGQVVAFIQGQNTGSAGEPGSASASGTGGGYTGGAACPLPP